MKIERALAYLDLSIEIIEMKLRHFFINFLEPMLLYIIEQAYLY